ncbi:MULTISPECIES: hypothetical protein [Neobacillus]|uniref:Uncharacterized protein n=1 Tax=Neobacillus rhizophilus TaxID=2833579 RepID=A0A942UB49_9BACI|nr:MULTISPECIES: hypothetical protein [Neobacillus]MBS4216017.1 hypothetical protein [Neobacillus rhizophilus]MBU8916086.1 hypothetical protein [Bacillus sp. FJAT-29953]
MRIDQHYRASANLSLNGSIAAILPATLIITGNFSFSKTNEIMLLSIPFILYSFFAFQLYLFRMKQSQSIHRNLLLVKKENPAHSLFEARHLLLLHVQTFSPRLQLFLPNGNLAASIEKKSGGGLSFFNRIKTFTLYNSHEEAVGFFKVKDSKFLKIEVFDRNWNYLGCMEKRKISWNNSKKELLDVDGKYIGAVEGSALYMDELVLNKGDRLEVRLRKGWMPLEWSRLFPNPNTPVLTFAESLTKEDKLLRMSFLINEYFIER